MNTSGAWALNKFSKITEVVTKPHVGEWIMSGMQIMPKLPTFWSLPIWREGIDAALIRSEESRARPSTSCYLWYDSTPQKERPVRVAYLATWFVYRVFHVAMRLLSRFRWRGPLTLVVAPSPAPRTSSLRGPWSTEDNDVNSPISSL